MKKEYKECPFCVNEIKKKAVKCQYCGEPFTNEEQKNDIKEDDITWMNLKKNFNNKDILNKNNAIKNDQSISFDRSTIRTYIWRIITFFWYIFLIIIFIKPWIDSLFGPVWSSHTDFESSWWSVAMFLIIYEIVSLFKTIKKIKNNQYIARGIEKSMYIRSIMYSAIVIRLYYTGGLLLLLANNTINTRIYRQLVDLNKIRVIAINILIVGLFDLIINCINRKKVNLWRAIFPSYLSLAITLYMMWKFASSGWYPILFPLLILSVFAFFPAILSRIFRSFYTSKKWNTHISKDRWSRKLEWIIDHFSFIQKMFKDFYEKVSGKINSDKNKLWKKIKQDIFYFRKMLRKFIKTRNMILITFWILTLLGTFLLVGLKYYEKKKAENICLTNYWIHSTLIEHEVFGNLCECKPWYDWEGAIYQSQCISNKKKSDKECQQIHWIYSHWDWSKNFDGEYNCRCNTWYILSINWVGCISNEVAEVLWTIDCQETFWEKAYSDWSYENWWYNCRCREGFIRNQDKTKCTQQLIYNI